MKKSKQIVKTEAKKGENILNKNDIEFEKETELLSLNDDDLEPLSDTVDFKNLLTQSYDISKTLTNSVAQVKNSQLSDFFSLDTNKIGHSLKCNAFYKNFEQDFLIQKYFDQNLIETFDRQENENRIKFDELYHKNKRNLVELKEIGYERTIESDKKNKDEIILKPVETKTQNIDDWLDELID